MGQALYRLMRPLRVNADALVAPRYRPPAAAAGATTPWAVLQHAPRHARAVALAVLALVIALPLLAALAWLMRDVAAAWAGGAFARMAVDSQVMPAWRAGLCSAGLSTVLALGLALVATTALHGTPAWQRLQRGLGAALAVPHAAFAVGLALWLMPAGWLARSLAPLAGWADPPAWASVHDAAGLGLAAVLTLKETPFLLWCLAALLVRPEVAAEVQRTEWVARSLGYGRVRAWALLLWPRWLSHLGWPLAAVWAYGLTVVDVALVIGPTHPPTLAVLAWQNLADADAQRQADGVAQVALLALTLAVGLVIAAVAWRGLRSLLRRLAVRGVRARPGPAPAAPRRAAGAAVGAVAGVYVAVVGALALASITRLWPFPLLWPESFGLEAWMQLGTAVDTIATTVFVAVAASGLSALLVLAWFEAAPAVWDRWAAALVLAPLVVPPLLWLVGLYGLALHLGLDGSVAGLVWVHVLMVVPYSFITLAGAWRSFDPGWQRSAALLGRSQVAFWLQVKLPMLRAPLAAGLAVGFAVSVAQYLPTQFIGAGRLATVTTETVALAAGGQRMQAAAFALLQALLPLLAFGAAAWAAAQGRQRAAQGRAP